MIETYFYFRSKQKLRDLITEGFVFTLGICTGLYDH